jgi:hypothetical protein
MLTLARHYGEEMVELRVGPRHHCAIFNVHKQLLNEKSDSFREAFADSPDEIRYTLPDVNPVTFHEVFVSYPFSLSFNELIM